MTATVDRRPARFSSAVAGGAALVAALAGSLYSWVGLALGAAGVVLLVAGLVRRARRLVMLATVALFAGAVAAGGRGAPVAPVLLGGVAAVVAGDAGLTALSVGAQLGREADTRRLEATRALASGGVGLLSVGLVYGVYRAGSGGQPAVALVLMLVAAALLVEALD